MQIPGFVWTALIAGVTTFLTMLQTGFSADPTDYLGSAAVVLIATALRAIEVWKPPADGTRSVTAPRSKVSRFLLGG